MTNHTRNDAQPDDDEMLEHYQLDYTKAKPNRFAGPIGPDSMMIVLDPDVAAVFPTAEAVNDTLRVIAAALQNVPRSSDIHYVANAKQTEPALLLLLLRANPVDWHWEQKRQRGISSSR